MNNTAQKASAGQTAHRKGMPLALVIGRYFLYVLVTTGLLVGVLLTAFGILVANGTVYIASYADDHAPEVVQLLESGQISVDDIPSAYQWAEFDENKSVVASDMPEGDIATLESKSLEDYAALGSLGKTERATLPNGNVCLLSYDFLPDFTSRDLRDALPDPQSLLLGAFVILFVVTIGAIALRASRVISRKMRPLSEAATNIERQNLDFTVGSTNVREMNEVLAAMERMRSSLDESLKARWAADEAQRNQVAALAHDLKTPLSVARWNTDLLYESGLHEDQIACAEGLSESINRLDDYVRLLTETSQRGATPLVMSAVDIAALAASVKQQAEQLCKARGLALKFSCTSHDTIQGNEVALERAVMNILTNASEHAPSGSNITVGFADQEDKLLITIEDEGPGFSATSLKHGKDRFYTGTESRSSQKGHYGLGLSIVEDIARAHEGTFTLQNTSGGALCTLALPKGLTGFAAVTHTDGTQADGLQQEHEK